MNKLRLLDNFKALAVKSGPTEQDSMVGSERSHSGLLYDTMTPTWGMTACHTDSANDCHQESLYLQAITDIIKSNGWANFFFQGQIEEAIKLTEKHI